MLDVKPLIWFRCSARERASIKMRKTAACSFRSNEYALGLRRCNNTLDGEPAHDPFLPLEVTQRHVQSRGCFKSVCAALSEVDCHYSTTPTWRALVFDAHDPPPLFSKPESMSSSTQLGQGRAGQRLPRHAPGLPGPGIASFWGLPGEFSCEGEAWGMRLGCDRAHVKAGSPNLQGVQGWHKLETKQLTILTMRRSL